MAKRDDRSHAAGVVVDRLDRKNDLLGTFRNADKQNHNTNYGGKAIFGLPKYQSWALLSTEDGTHDTQQVAKRSLCKRMTNHLRKTYRLLK